MQLLDIVKLPRDFAKRRPRQLSGGQKQRVGIARAFAGNPRVVIADEPVSALDVSVQAAVTELLMDIQRDHRTTLLFISHDLSVVRYLADRIVVMYLGRSWSRARPTRSSRRPTTPIPRRCSPPSRSPTPRSEEAHRARGRHPLAVNPPPGCPFQTRCPRKLGKICETEAPPVREFGRGHKIACHIEPGRPRAHGPGDRDPRPRRRGVAERRRHRRLLLRS